MKYKPVSRLIATTKDLVFAGNSAHKLSLAITLGILFGVLPFLGVTTICLALLALIFRLNMIVIQLANYMMYPIQVLLYIPFIKTGKNLGNLQMITATKVYAIMKENWMAGIDKLWQIHLWAILVWFIFSLPTGYLLYIILNRWIGRIKIQMEKNL